MANEVSVLDVAPAPAPNSNQYMTVNFGQVRVTTQAVQGIRLSASGDAPTKIKNITVSGAYYDARTNCPDVLPSGQSCIVNVYFWPMARGFWTGDLMFYLDSGTIQAHLLGNGI
jgi:hypothetical protein